MSPERLIKPALEVAKHLGVYALHLMGGQQEQHPVMPASITYHNTGAANGQDS